MPDVSPSRRAPARLAPMRHLALGFMGSVVLFAAACGGKVVVDASGNGGSGSGGAGNGGNVSSSGVVSPVGVVSVSTGGGSLCEQVCSSLAAKGCDTNQGCVADCLQTYESAPACAPLLDAFLGCVVQTSSPGCDLPVECEGESNAFGACIGGNPPGCGDTACGGNSGSCACKVVCDDHTLSVECSPGNATDFCTCFKDGVPVGKCTMPQTGMMSCGIVDGCCADVFFP